MSAESTSSLVVVDGDGSLGLPAANRAQTWSNASAISERGDKEAAPVANRRRSGGTHLDPIEIDSDSDASSVAEMTTSESEMRWQAGTSAVESSNSTKPRPKARRAKQPKKKRPKPERTDDDESSESTDVVLIGPPPRKERFEGEYSIPERIVGVRMDRNRKFYRIKWLNYPDSRNTWEPAATYDEDEDFSALVEDFRIRRQKKESLPRGGSAVRPSVTIGRPPAHLTSAPTALAASDAPIVVDDETQPMLSSRPAQPPTAPRAASLDELSIEDIARLDEAQMLRLLRIEVREIARKSDWEALARQRTLARKRTKPHTVSRVGSEYQAVVPDAPLTEEQKQSEAERRRLDGAMSGSLVTLDTPSNLYHHFSFPYQLKYAGKAVPGKARPLPIVQPIAAGHSFEAARATFLASPTSAASRDSAEPPGRRLRSTRVRKPVQFPHMLNTDLASFCFDGIEPSSPDSTSSVAPAFTTESTVEAATDFGDGALSNSNDEVAVVSVNRSPERLALHQLHARQSLPSFSDSIPTSASVASSTSSHPSPRQHGTIASSPVVRVGASGDAALQRSPRAGWTATRSSLASPSRRATSPHSSVSFGTREVVARSPATARRAAMMTGIDRSPIILPRLGQPPLSPILSTAAALPSALPGSSPSPIPLPPPSDSQALSLIHSPSEPSELTLPAPSPLVASSSPTNASVVTADSAVESSDAAAMVIDLTSEGEVSEPVSLSAARGAKRSQGFLDGASADRAGRLQKRLKSDASLETSPSFVPVESKQDDDLELTEVKRNAEFDDVKHHDTETSALHDGSVSVASKLARRAPIAPRRRKPVTAAVAAASSTALTAAPTVEAPLRHSPTPSSHTISSPARRSSRAR